MATPNLNWLEISSLVDLIRPKISGMFVDRLTIPARPLFPGGFIKGEWGLRLTTRKQEGLLYFSVRPRNAYLCFIEEKGPNSAPGSTHSAFDLALSKHLRGARISGIEAIPRERVVVIDFGGVESREQEAPYALVLSLIPARPEALLVKKTEPSSWEIVARSRTLRNEKVETHWSAPDGAQAPDSPPVRPDLSLESACSTVEKALETEAFELRSLAVARLWRETLKLARDRIRQSETSIREAQAEPDWKRFGDLMKPILATPPPIQAGFRELMDYETGQNVRVPCDPKLGPQAQVEKFYHQARRRQRRIEEARIRLEGAMEREAKAERSLAAMPKPLDWKALEKMERDLGIAKPDAGASEPKKTKSRAGAWMGRTFTSKDGLLILVGRSRDENLELTFKHARGNDLWMHVRGKPGAHTLIPLSSGKSAPLETLLDAAAVTVFYSGGEKWGKTEVDYTFKKHVKRIKDSTEASYTHNKTLIVEPDPPRLKRLLSSQNA